MKPNVKKLINALFLLITLGVVLYIGFSGNDISELRGALATLSPVYLLLCLLCWALYVFSDAMCVHYFLLRQGHKLKLRQSLHSAIVGIYYSSITPSASGGQPMQIYTLSKYKVPIGISGSALAVKFIAFEVATLIAGAVLWTCNAEFVARYTAEMEWAIILGFVVKAVWVLGLIAMAASPRAVSWLIAKVIRIGTKLKLCKDPEKTSAAWEKDCRSFNSSIRLIARHPRQMLAQCGIALCQLLSIALTVVVLYHAYSLEGANDIQLITMGVLLFIAASYTPLPGASGAQEVGFAVLFKGIFPEAKLFVALLLWRFATYYLSVLVGAVVTTVSSVRGIRGADREAEQNGHIGT